jgi:pimeloyl-ACP methyl ester carboxylesterase
VVDQVLYMLDSQDPADVVDWFRGMNAAHLGSEKVHQDVLLMVGEHDAFQPSSLARAQARALTAARSVTTRLFTRAEHADQHCQLGNLELACHILTTWLHAPNPTEPPARHRPGLRPSRQEPTL